MKKWITRFKQQCSFVNEEVFSTTPITQSGFTLIEALMATVVMGVGFVGTFTLVGVVQQSSYRAMIEQNLTMQAGQILDIIEADVENIADYNNMNLSACAEPAEDVTATSILRGYEWCLRLNDHAGVAQAEDTRRIDVLELTDDSRAVEVLLEGDNGAVQVVMKRVYGL